MDLALNNLQRLICHKTQTNVSSSESDINICIEKEKNTIDWLSNISYLPTPPLGQDMTQGQYLSGI